MPSFWTHFAFAKECKDMLPHSELSEAIACHPHAYYSGMQGPDMFLFYLPAVLRKKRLSTELHTNRPAKLLTCLWRQAKKTKGDDRKIALAYAAGFLGHYCLDSETHPFVYAFAGIERTTESFCIHNALEADLNRLAVERTFGIAPNALPFPDVYHLPNADRACIARMLSRAIRCVYKLNCTPATVARALGAVRLWCYLLRDKTGRKAKLFRAIEAPLRLPYLSPFFLGISHYYEDSANFAHRPWQDPYTGKLSHTDFFALYDSAKEKYSNAIAILQTLPVGDIAACLRELCERDFHGEPDHK